MFFSGTFFSFVYSNTRYRRLSSFLNEVKILLRRKPKIGIYLSRCDGIRSATRIAYQSSILARLYHDSTNDPEPIWILLLILYTLTYIFIKFEFNPSCVRLDLSRIDRSNKQRIEIIIFAFATSRLLTLLYLVRSSHWQTYYTYTYMVSHPDHSTM